MVLSNVHEDEDEFAPCFFEYVLVFHLHAKDESVEAERESMGWWPFGKKTSPRHRIDDPLRKDTRQWLSELRDVCEMNFDNPEGLDEKSAKCKSIGIKHMLKVPYLNTTGKGWRVAHIGYLPVQMMNGWNGWTTKSFGNQDGALTKTLNEDWKKVIQLDLNMSQATLHVLQTCPFSWKV